MNLQDKVAIVTGASSGLGAVLSRHLAGRGARVFGLARRADRMQSLETELGDRFRAIRCDVREEPSVREAIQSVLDETGRIDVLVNNAGLAINAPVDQQRLEDWDTQVETNLRGVFVCTRAVIPTMKEQNRQTGFGGHIVNIASIAGLIGNPGLSAYNATKFGVRGFSEAIMKELRNDGIKVTCVYPGSIATDFSLTSGSSGSPNAMTSEEISDTVLHILETGDNYLISEIVMRPLRPKG